MPYIAFDGTSFDDVVKKMPEYLQELRACEPFTPDERGYLRRNGEPLPKIKGVYCLYEGEKPLYIGRTDNIRNRVLAHRRAGNVNNQAAFAFNIAKEEFEKDHPRRDISGLTRKELERDGDFAPLFTKAKERVRKMSVRFVEIEDPIEQTIFEVYAHMELVTPPRFNSFENH